MKAQFSKLKPSGLGEGHRAQGKAHTTDAPHPLSQHRLEVPAGCMQDPGNASLLAEQVYGSIRGDGGGEEVALPGGIDAPSGEWIQVFLRLLLLQRWKLAQVALFGAIAGAILAFSLPERFESTARLMPPQNDVNSASALGGGLQQMASPLLIRIMESRTVRDRIIERFDLKKVYGAPLSETARAALANNTRFDENRNSGITSITVTDKIAQRAADICNAYADELNRIITEITTSSARRERFFLENRLKVIKPDLDSAASALGEFSSKNMAIDIQEQGDVLVSSETLLNGQLASAKSQLEGLKQTYANGSVEVRELAARTQELARALQRIDGYLDEESTGSEGARDSLYPSLRTLPLLEVPYSNLSHRTDIQDALYLSLFQMAELAKIQEARETPSVEILDYAMVSRRKSFPPRFLIIAAGGLFFFMCAVGWCLVAPKWEVFRQALDCTRNPAQVHR